MPFLADIMKYLPLIQTGASVAGNVLGGRAQQGAINNASQVSNQATQDAMRMILGLYDQGQASLAPYSGVGPGALSNLQRMAGVAPSTTPPPPTNSYARFTGNPMMGGNGNVQAAMGQPRPSGKNALLGSAGGAAATMGMGLASGAMLGAPISTGLSLGLGALGGPIGIGAGLLGSYIGSKFGKNNPYKEAASKGIDQVSRNIWGTNTPGIPMNQLTSGYVADMLAGRTSYQEGKAKINADIDSWVQGMRQNGTPEDVIKSSVQTQMQHLQPLKQLFAGQGAPNANF